MDRVESGSQSYRWETIGRQNPAKWFATSGLRAARQGWTLSRMRQTKAEKSKTRVTSPELAMGYLESERTVDLRKHTLRFVPF